MAHTAVPPITIKEDIPIHQITRPADNGVEITTMTIINGVHTTIISHRMAADMEILIKRVLALRFCVKDDFYIAHLKNLCIIILNNGFIE